MSNLEYSSKPKMGSGWIIAGARLGSVALLLLTGYFMIQLVIGLGQDPSAVGPRSVEERMIQDAQEAVNQDPQNVTARWQLSLALSTVKSFRQAKAEAENAVKLDPQSVEAYYALGVAYRGLGDSDRAVKALEKAGSLPGSFADVYREIFYDLGEVHSEAGRHEQALAAFGSALASGPEATYVVIRVAEEYRKAGNTEKAKEEYINALGYNPDNVQIEDALRELGATEEEIEAAKNPIAHRAE